VNFFGHALVAASQSSEPAWVLGAMAPDFATMGGVRLEGPRERAPQTRLQEGVVFHHTTDDAFHGAPTFLALMKEARIDLQAREVGTGAALGISHVGVELLLDGWLLDERGLPECYDAALEAGAELAEELFFRGEDPGASRAQWRRVCQRLQQAPVPEGYRDPQFVAERLIGILAKRPRLAVAAGRERGVHEWAERFLPRVAASGAALWDEVATRLAGGA
jgi:hypothetical protein